MRATDCGDVMSNFSGSFTIASTGSPVTFSGIGFQPTRLKFTVGGKSNSATVIQRCDGWVDETGYYGTHSHYGDSTGFESKHFNTKVLYHRERIAGTLTTVLDATFHSFTADGFKLNVTTANSNYPVWVEAMDV